jgi:hypothetical protein
MTQEKTISSLVERQLPDFVRADHPQFQRFLELYYEWMEDESKGNTVYHIMHAEKYRDIDETLVDPFVRLFKQELLPYFPETSTLDLVKILKGAREFYVRKGSVESVKWLFRVLFGQEIEIYYPKHQILIASDGKWKLPQAFQLTLSDGNLDIDVNLLEKHKATGSVSKATCIIESANKTIDKTFGNEILEMYVSNVFREFTNGENLEIPYVDENGLEQVFSETIIGALSGIRVDSNILTDPQQKRRGLLYNVGDPVVVFGGLSDTPEAADAVAFVGNVSVGSIEGLSVTFPGYGYRSYSNTESIVYRSNGDDPSANLSTDIRVVAFSTTDSVSNSNAKFLERIYVDKMPIEYVGATVLSDADWTLLSGNVKNMSVTLTGTSDMWYRYEDWYSDSQGSYQTANVVGKILTANTGWTGGPQAGIVLYDVKTIANGKTLLAGNTITTTNSSHNYTVSSIQDTEVNANLDSQIIQVLNFEAIDTGGVSLYNIINGGYGFRSVPIIVSESYFDTFLSEAYAYGTAGKTANRQPMGAYGEIAHVYIDNPGDGYANGDAIVIGDRGYGFTGFVNVGVGGVISNITITSRGEGYYGNVDTRSVSVTSGSGANAFLSAYGFGEGTSVGVETGAIGRVKDVRMEYRGFDYIDTPIVSFKVVDMIINGIGDNEVLSEGERVFQGATLLTSSFQGIVKSYNRSTKLLRLFDYSGNAFTNFNPTLTFTSEGGVQFTLNTNARVPAPSDSYPPEVIASGLPNPHFYGNGKAKGIAEFFNGLIKFNGFYLNTDGFLSSDKKLQDANVYHNYSYVIESEKNLSDYRNIMMDVVHPLGMSMLGRTISKSELEENITPTGIVYTVPGIATGSTITVANSFSVVVTGASTEFANSFFAAVGDMLILKDTVHPLRSQAKVIKSIASDTSLNVESWFNYLGQGTITTNVSNNVIVVSGNTDPLGDFIMIGDNIRLNIFPANIYSNQTGTVNVAAGSVLVIGTGTAFTSQARVGDWIKVNNEVRLVVNVANTTQLNVNSSFIYSSNDVVYQRRAGEESRLVTAINGDRITLNTIVFGTCTILYRINPDYTGSYAYEIIKVTTE